MSESETVYLCTLVFALASLAVVAVFHALAWFDIGSNQGVFVHTMGESWRMYDLDILEVDWLFPIWMTVYSLQLIWLIYGFIALCRETKAGSLIINPPIIPSSIFVTFILGLAGTIGWVVLWDSHIYAVYSSICIMGSCVFLILTLAISLQAVNLYQDEVKLEGNTGDIWAIRVVLQNCVAIYASWTAIITCYTVCMLLYDFNLLTKELAQYITLAIMMALLLIYMLMDFCGSRHLGHFLIAPYLVFGVAFLQPFLKYLFLDENSNYFIISAVFLGVCLFIAVIKLLIAFGRCCCQRPKSVYIPEEEFCAIEYRESDDSSTGSGGAYNDGYMTAVGEMEGPSPY